jgi:CubicO group peptidase (beta-lactamase class C family)
MGRYSETLKITPYANISIRRALQMRSGISKYDTKEGWKLWWMATGDKKEGYEGKNYLKKHIKTVRSMDGSGNISEYHPNDSFALSIMVQEFTGSSIATNFNTNIFSKISPSANGYWMTDAEGITLPNSGLFITARDWAKIGNFVQVSINENNCMGKFFKDGVKTASKSSRITEWKFGYHFWTKKGLIIFAGFGGQTVYVNPKNKTVVMASSVNPKYGDEEWIFEIAETVVKQ